MGPGTSLGPIPGAVWLLGSGLLGLIGLKRKFLAQAPHPSYNNIQTQRHTALPFSLAP